MKRIRKIICLNIVISIILLCFSSCGKIHMDEEKCAEVALDYMINKYGKEFVLIDSSEKMQIAGPAGYARVEVKPIESETSYWISVYPDGKSDKNKDGYYDKYKVISDDYMCYLMNDSVKKEVDKLLIEAGLTRFLSSVGISQCEGKHAGFSGFSVDFPVQHINNFSLIEILKNYSISIYCSVDIPESEYSDVLQNNITKSMKKLITQDDFIDISIDVYDDEKYGGFEEQIKNGKGYYGGLGIKSIEFLIDKEEN